MKTFRCFEGGLLSLGLLLLCPALRTDAQPVIYQATGTREQIQSIVDQFKHDIVYGPNGSELNPPLRLGQVRTTGLDDLNPFDRTYSIGGYPISGRLMLTSGITLSANTSDPNDPNRLFGDVNAMYPEIFQAFSPPVIGAVGRGPNGPVSAEIGVQYDQFPNYANAFGAVFVDVDAATSAGLKGFASQGQSTVSFSFNSPAEEQKGEFSFIGVIYPGEMFAGTWIRMNTLITSPSAFEEGPMNDMVAVDDIILGITPDMPEPSPLALLGIGAFVFWIFFRHRRKPNSC